jgi:LuxR family quorum sensing-dependent transcriptional regulator
VLDTVEEISRLTSVIETGSALAEAMEKFGFAALGINGLPPPGEGADPLIITERTPEGFRDLYIEERFYLVDHISRHARATHQPFRYNEAPYDRAEAPAHHRFMQALQTFGMGEGLIVPVGRRAATPTCVWLAGRHPDLDDASIVAAQLVSLFAASKAIALSQPSDPKVPASPLTSREREALRWAAAGKTSWEISMISGVSERAVNKVIADAMVKLDAATRIQAVVIAIRIGEIEF